MRVIGGKYKRSALEAPEGTDVTRPTSDRIKENIFNLLASVIPEARVLDLFSGSGALGIEALSRGATHVTFVEHNSRALTALRNNLLKLKIPREHFEIVGRDVRQFLQHAVSERKEIAASIDIILADPPYRSNWYDEAIGALETSALCRPGCQLVLEMGSQRQSAEDSAEAHADSELNSSAKSLALSSWQIVDSRKYGKTRIEIWVKGENANLE